MTFILFAMNQNYLVHVADRRLTSANSIFDEEHPKSFILNTVDARMAVAFTGLARAGAFETSSWLLDTILGIADTDRTAEAVINRLVVALNDRFERDINIRTLNPQTRRLSVIFAGYLYIFDPPLGVSAEITNNRTDGSIGTFVALFTREKEPRQPSWSLLGAYGNGAALKDSHVMRLRRAVEKDVRPGAMSELLEGTVREIAGSSLSQDTIGQQLDTIWIPADGNLPAQGGHSSSVIKREAIMPPGIFINESGALAMKGMEIRPVEVDTPPLTVPKVHRNAPCPCGSKKRYRECHGLRHLDFNNHPPLPKFPGQ